MDNKSGKIQNNLANSQNPHLLQHSCNPIDWHEWNEQTLQKVKDEDKLIFLSIGYSTCYWCHVMEREVFEDEEIASLLKDKFIAIKVDREERPDLDNLYLTANIIFTGRGEWPNNLFLTPDQEPVFAHTYLDKREFSGLIKNIGDTWQSNREDIISQAYMLTDKTKVILAKPQ